MTLLLTLGACAHARGSAAGIAPDGEGLASWYGRDFAGKPTASGELFDPGALTAAHRTLPFGTCVRVEHESRSVEVRVNDRGPFVKGRIIDVSEAAARELGLLDKGFGQVRLRSCR